MSNGRPSVRSRVVLVLLAAGALAVTLRPAVSVAGTSPAQRTPAPPEASASAAVAAWRTFQGPYYRRRWGVDIVGVHLVSSGSMVEFRYRVLDTSKAAVLSDKRWNPYLEDLASGAKVGVPNMDNVGRIRQVGPQVEGREYWVIFANPAKLIKPGDRVNVTIGDFQATGIVVE